MAKASFPGSIREAHAGVGRLTGRVRAVANLSMLAVLAASLGMAGCRDREGLSNVRAVALNEPEQRHPIQFSYRSEVMLVEIPRDGRGLSPSQKTDVYRFVRRYKTVSTDPLVVSSPSRMNDHLAARHSVRDLDDILRQNDIAPSAVQPVRHARLEQGRPVLRLSFRRPVAVPPSCGRWPKDVGVDRERVHYENFGCATQRNFALTAGNARDIMGPQPSAPRSSERRDTVWREYVSEPASAGGGGGQVPSSSPSTTN